MVPANVVALYRFNLPCAANDCLQASSSRGRTTQSGRHPKANEFFVVHVIRHEETIRIISAREATREERRQYEDVVEDLKRVAPTLGFAGYQPLIRAYIGKGLRIDLARLDEGSVPRLIASLKRKGVTDSLIQQALAETDQAT
jgi:uncharacterized DUF497 family protein